MIGLYEVNKKDFILTIEKYINEHGFEAAQDCIEITLNRFRKKAGRPKGNKDYIENGLAVIIQQLFGPFPYPPEEELKLPRNWRLKTIKFLDENPGYASRIFNNENKAQKYSNWTYEAKKQALSREIKKMKRSYLNIYNAYEKIKQETKEKNSTIEEIFKNIK